MDEEVLIVGQVYVRLGLLQSLISFLIGKAGREFSETNFALGTSEPASRPGSAGIPAGALCVDRLTGKDAGAPRFMERRVLGFLADETVRIKL